MTPGRKDVSRPHASNCASPYQLTTAPLGLGSYRHLPPGNSAYERSTGRADGFIIPSRVSRLQLSLILILFRGGPQFFL